MALVIGGNRKRSLREIAHWHSARDAYKTAFPLNQERDGSYMRWMDAAEEYAVAATARFRGWRDLQDPRSPYYAENRAYLAQRQRVLASV